MTQPQAQTQATLPSADTDHRAETFARLRRRRRPWRTVVALLLVVAVAAGVFVFTRRRAAPTAGFITAGLLRGEVRESVRATGTVQPVLQVQVGAQASGRIARVEVSYNSHVRAGDLLAEIDPTPARVQLAQARAARMIARAQLAQNQANLQLAERALTRARALRERDLNAAADLDGALSTRDAARAAVGLARAQIAQADAGVAAAEANLTYTRILAPIDGIVATRSVDPGQTVAASFQTPTLFVIANDLSQMQVIANVDEANIGRLTEGMRATARVDAFPRETFQGAVRELRITPTTTNGVVTYQTVISVDNANGRLRPGMTATITVTTAVHRDVLLVPNAALRYHPPASASASHPGSGAPASLPSEMTPPSGGPPGGMPPGAMPSGATPSGGAPPGASESASRDTVYVLRDGRPQPVAVRTGLTNGTVTEVSGEGLAPGVQIVLESAEASGQTPQRAPGGPPGGGGPPRMF